MSAGQEPWDRLQSSFLTDAPELKTPGNRNGFDPDQRRLAKSRFPGLRRRENPASIRRYSSASRFPESVFRCFPFRLSHFTSHTPDASPSPAASSLSRLSRATSALFQTPQSSEKSSTLPHDTDVPLPSTRSPVSPSPAPLPLAKIAAVFATVAQKLPVAPARTAPSTSKTQASCVLSSNPRAPAHPPAPACHSQSLHRLAAPAPPLPFYPPLSAASRAAPISPSSNKPEAVKSPPNPALRTAPAPHSPGIRASAAPPASSAAPGPRSSASPRPFLSFSSLCALCAPFSASSLPKQPS